MDRILFIVPHLSTGGMPQFVLKQIEKFKDAYDIYLVEWDDITGGVYVVQRNAIANILGDRFIALGHEKSNISDIIKKVNPLVIHFHEVPETFIDDYKLKSIFSKERGYFIVVTTHSSSTDPSSFNYIADRYILVSEWSRDIFEEYFKGETSCEVWEYPIDLVDYDKDLSKKEMGWDDDKIHVLNVGLFTRGKNQGELFELARTFGDDFVFHFVGNQAINFKDYWGPLMDDVPSNCVIHGERSDVHRFYKAADIFYFTSNYELSPLAIRESLSYGLPTFVKRLHTYKDMYDGRVTYITGNTELDRKNLIKSIEYKNKTI